MWQNPQFSADLVTFTEEIFNGKLHFCLVVIYIWKLWGSYSGSWKILKNPTLRLENPTLRPLKNPTLRLECMKYCSYEKEIGYYEVITMLVFIVFLMFTNYKRTKLNETNNSNSEAVAVVLWKSCSENFW